jgi:putative SOS response-associated peptidase YedK
MCYQTQLVVEHERSHAYWNKRIWDQLKQRPAIHHASVFARLPWPVVTVQEPELVQDKQCGLVPAYATDAADFLKHYPTYNAKSEEVYTKRTFRKAATEGRRCLVAVTGFFEWMHVGKDKVPYFIHKRGGGLFMFGGLYAGDTYTILTTRANERMARIHNTKQRMPVIIPEAFERDWLNPALAQDDVLALCAPVPEDYLEDWTVSKLITTRGADTNVPAVWQPFTYATPGPAPGPAPSLFPD